MADNFNTRLYARGKVGQPVTTSRAPVADRMKCKPAEPTCTDCGALKCVCRPRFFAGQLLTEQDLNRLDAYIRDKNRLHTLQLHGYGVVNGLEVTCDPCGEGVLVGCGYAISPCGDDIVVCERVAVDICALIKRCGVPVPCKPLMGQSGAGGCDDLVEDWVLSVRYAETATRGITALRMGACGCGATTVSACSCAGATQGKPRGASAECEPTVICEGYSFDMSPAPVESGRFVPGGKVTMTGALAERVLCCFRDVVASVPPPPKEAPAEQPALWQLWCCRMKEALIGYLTAAPGSDCELIARLSAVACPDPKLEPQQFVAALQVALSAMASAVVEILLGCLCAALLPPCPDPTDDDRIPLAVIRVRKKDCAILSVCNSTPLRRQVLTFPNIEYWLSLLPISRAFKELLHRLCCRPPRTPVVRQPDEPRAVVGVEGGNLAPAPGMVAKVGDSSPVLTQLNPSLSVSMAAENRTLSEMVMAAIQRGNTPLDPDAFAGSVLGFSADGKNPVLSENERANLGQFLVLNQVMRPLVASLLPEGGAAAVMTAVVGKQGPADNADMQAMQRRIDALEAQVAAMQKNP